MILRPSQVEAWTLSLVDRVRNRERIEDARVELKADWPDPPKAARRLAGHANAARGEPVLWVIGLDEERGVQETAPEDLAHWWPQVAREFEGLAPDTFDLIVPTEDGPVTALLIDGSRSPYLVKNPTYGTPGGGPVSLEVPWRDGTRVRSARREDLLRLLVPTLVVPEVEVLKGEAHITRNSKQHGVEFLWRVEFELYMIPKSAERIIIPFHRVSAEVRVGEITIDSLSPSLQPKKQRRPGGAFVIVKRSEPPPPPPRVLSHTIQASNSEVLIDGPGLVDFTLTGRTPELEIRSELLKIDAVLRPVSATVEAPLILELDPVEEREKGVFQWVWNGRGRHGS